MEKNNFEKPKALFILHLPPPVYGATIANEFLLNSTLINKTFNPIFLNLATNTKLSEVGKATTKKLFSLISIFFKVFKVLTQNKFDVCCVSLTASGPAFYKDLIVVSILKLFKVNIVYFFHNKGVAKASENPVNDYLYKYVFNCSRSIILSKHLYQDIEKYVQEKDVFYCPYGIPITNTAASSKRNVSDSVSCRLLFLGNMMVEKGVLILLEACKLLKDKNQLFSCHFVGGWTDITEEEFKDYVQKHELSEMVFVHGPKYNIEKISFYDNSDIFIFPTYYHYETFGLVNLEAMQYALPVISTPEGGIPEAIVHGENGFLVPQQNIEILAEKIELLINNPDLRTKMGLAGQKRFFDLFTVNIFEQNITSILSETAKSKALSIKDFKKEQFSRN